MVRLTALPGDVPTYIGMHKRVRGARGRARDYSCVGCGAPAVEWSYRHDDPAEVLTFVPVRRLSDDADLVMVAYSLDVGHYDPLCRSCHVKRDAAQYHSVG